MKILVDENIPAVTVRELRAVGHDLLDIRDTKYKGSEDETLWKIAQREGRLLITTDAGFSQHREEKHHGLLIIRLKQPNRQKIHERILQAMSQIKTWPGLLIVMQDRIHRIWQARPKK